MAYILISSISILHIVLITILLSLSIIAAPINQESGLEFGLHDLSPGSNTVSGFIFSTTKSLQPSTCSNHLLRVYEGTKLNQEKLLGSAPVRPDATFTVLLSRPLLVGDTITLYIECRPELILQDTLQIPVPPPSPIPEPTTLLLVGSGLTALGLRVLRSRRR